MSIEFEKLILQNKSQLLDSCLSFIQINHSSRTDNPSKCKRDLSYILNSIVNCVYSKNTADIHRIIHAFYIGGKLQLKSTTVEKQVYLHLKMAIVKLIQDYNLEKYHETLVEDIIDILVEKIDDGYDKSYSSYTNRRNYTRYDETIDVPIELEKMCDLVLQETPLQEPYTDMFSILKLTPQDREIKEFYCTHFFKNQHGTNMVAMLTAPLVYMVLPYKTDKANRPPSFDINMGIHGGALMAEVLNYGYDFSFIGCIYDNKDIDIIEKSNKILEQRFNLDMNLYNHHPYVCFCIGVGIKETLDDRGKIGDLTYCPLNWKEDSRKPPIIYG